MEPSCKWGHIYYWQDSWVAKGRRKELWVPWATSLAYMVAWRLCNGQPPPSGETTPQMEAGRKAPWSQGLSLALPPFVPWLPCAVANVLPKWCCHTVSHQIRTLPVTVESVSSQPFTEHLVTPFTAFISLSHPASPSASAWVTAFYYTSFPVYQLPMPESRWVYPTSQQLVV